MDTALVKKCSKCGVEKPLNEFYPKGNGVSSRCKECEKLLVSGWRKKNPEKKKEIERRWREKNPEKAKLAFFKSKLKYEYGLTFEQYSEMLSAQEGKCKICSVDLTRPCVDHCHLTGKIRGLLCQGCNLALGALKDSPELCLQAARYLVDNAE